LFSYLDKKYTHPARTTEECEECAFSKKWSDQEHRPRTGCQTKSLREGSPKVKLSKLKKAAIFGARGKPQMGSAVMEAAILQSGKGGKREQGTLHASIPAHYWAIIWQIKGDERDTKQIIKHLEANRREIGLDVAEYENQVLMPAVKEWESRLCASAIEYDRRFLADMGIVPDVAVTE
jgi:hypothetical protein